MDDLIERLRDHEVSRNHGGCQDCCGSLLDEGADEIERLRTQIENMKGYLRPLNELVVASEDDYCSEDTESGEWAEPDDEPVAAGVSHASSITFGTVRHARHAIDALFALTQD